MMWFLFFLITRTSTPTADRRHSLVPGFHTVCVSCTTNIPGSTYILNTTNEVTMLKILLVGLERKERETYTFRFRTTITIKLLSNIVLESKNY